MIIQLVKTERTSVGQRPKVLQQVNYEEKEGIQGEPID